MTNETKKVVEQLRSYINGARTAAYHNATPDYEEDRDLDYTRGLLDGYKEGLHDGYEGSLGLLETVETQLDYHILDDDYDNEVPTECYDDCLSEDDVPFDTEDYDCDPYEDAKAEVIDVVDDIISRAYNDIDLDDVKDKYKDYARDVIYRIRIRVSEMKEI